ncbi:uncharacterized mitochondrial protein AtMg00310-like [Hibiscus syriacus]|uniref:uncharacterized mitochondrial protein AtMg00310-like n=1 Tax=Hibiscus syriacus TaxID=106335 RepID=UPI001922EBDB|nr:uncharacterized mitochondrial protein AtMg00310-like [Hibiscus syriacus]
MDGQLVYFMQTSRLPSGVCSEIDKIVHQFIWGSTTTTRKTPLVNWDVLCQPIDRVGLDVDRSYNHNTAFLWKYGYALVVMPNAMWIQMLRQKYRMTDLCPESIARSCYSPMWRDLSNTWDLFRMNILWLPSRDVHSRI